MDGKQQKKTVRDEFAEKFISILEKIVVFSYKMYKEECEIILFYEVIYNIIGIILRYIEISTDIFIENIQKLTEY